MAMETRDGTCKTCDGKIWRYPHPEPDQFPDKWAHLNRADWIDNPHEAEPVEESSP